MDGDATRPLTLTQAKARLRAAAESIETSTLVPIEPRRAMLLALLAGILVGTGPGARASLAKVLVGLLFD